MSPDRLFALPGPPLLRDHPGSYVLAATRWESNAHLIADCARLGYLWAEAETLDVTFGKGGWWALWAPANLVTNDIDPGSGAAYHDDFRSLHWAANTFDVVAYDPPYVSPGGRETSTAVEFNNRYGLGSTPRSAPALQRYINDGLAEVARVARPGGFVLAKTKNYVTRGRLWTGTFHTWQAASALGLELADVLEHISGTGPQSQKSQQHARSNYSTLLVLRKERRRVNREPPLVPAIRGYQGAGSGLVTHRPPDRKDKSSAT